MVLLHLLLGVFGVEDLVINGGSLVTGEEERESGQVVAGGMGDVDRYELGSHVSYTVGTDNDIDEVVDDLKGFDHGSQGRLSGLGTAVRMI